MNKYVAFLGLITVAGFAAVGATEAPIASPTPDPFIPAKLEKESFGATMRRDFHKIRTTWDDYFKVWDKPRENHECTTLDKIRGTPIFFMHRKVEFNIYLNKRGSFFRAILAPFHRDTHANFSCWNYSADLWDREQRTDVFPFLYVDLKDDKIIRKIDGCPQFTPLHVWGNVTMVSEGFPWITLTDAEQLKEPTHSLASLRDLELAWTTMDKKNWTMAERELKAVIEKDIPVQTRIKVYEALGYTQMHLRKYPSARESLVKGQRLYGSPRVQFVDYLALRDTTAVNSLVLLTKTDLVLGNYEEAVEAGDLALYLQPNNAVARAEYGLALAKAGDAKKGLWEIDQAQRMSSGERLAEANRNRAMVFLDQGNVDGARTELENAIIIKVSDPQLHIELGDVYALSKDWAKAQSSYESAAKLAPEMPEPVFKLAGVFKSMADAAAAENKADDAKKYQDLAIKNCEECEKIDDTFGPAYLLHAELLKAQGKAGDADKILRKGLKNSRGSSMIQKAIEDQAPKSAEAVPGKADRVIVDGVEYSIDEAKAKFPTLKIESPKTEAPAADAKPAAEAPKADAPKAEEPKKEDPKAGEKPAEGNKQTAAPDNHKPVIDVETEAKPQPAAR
ncbi:MAG: hypothetical protein HY291_04530 [Planctomycetes bacterium]|nr:hypothetical protein [Planctomycetota bacterium]